MATQPGILVACTEVPGGVVLRFDDGEELTVARDAAAGELPRVGDPVPDPQRDALREAAARKEAARRLFMLIDRRLWPRARLLRKLCDEGLPAAAVEAVLDQAEQQGLLSDRQVAAACCRDALRARPVGRVLLLDKLRLLGIARDLAVAVVDEELPADREADLAQAAAQARWRRERGRDARAVARVQRFLQARGFSAAVCREAAQATRPRD